jgi:hypothetical protein
MPPPAQVDTVVEAVGFKPVYVGPIRYARNLEVGWWRQGSSATCWHAVRPAAADAARCWVHPQALAELWIHMSVPGVGTAEKILTRDFNFQFIRK